MTTTNAAFEAFAQSHAGTGRINPYWKFENDTIQFVAGETSRKYHPQLVGDIPFDVRQCENILYSVRVYFQTVYNAWHSEAQVLCVPVKDAHKLQKFGIPSLTNLLPVSLKDDDIFLFMGMYVKVFVLPQNNTAVNSCISEECWQQLIVKQDIHPLMRIHSHHILDAYQSATDYATLNSNTLEMVMGHIFEEQMHVGYWLDVYGTDIKSNVWVATETDNLNEPFDTIKIPCGNIRITKSSTTM